MESGTGLEPLGVQPPQEEGKDVLPFAPLSAIARMPEEERWLVEGILLRSGITVMASTPKSGKTWVSLALAVGVASGTSVLGPFHVASPGRVLLFPAEDDARAIRERTESICRSAGLELEQLPIDVVTADQLRLDAPEDRARLERLLELQRPKLLVLDPLVRLHSGAESYAGHIAELFGYLRSLQRRFGLAVVVTHHLAKNRKVSESQPGLAMRGSGDIHAAYDTGILLRRVEDGRILVTLEHRSSRAPDPFAFRLLTHEGGGTSFGWEEYEEAATEGSEAQRGGGGEGATRREASAGRDPGVPLATRVLELLRGADAPVAQVAMRKQLSVRNQVLTETLRALQAEKRVQHLGRMKGWISTKGAE